MKTLTEWAKLAILAFLLVWYTALPSHANAPALHRAVVERQSRRAWF